MPSSSRFTAFAGENLLMTGVSWEVAAAVRKVLDQKEPGQHISQTILIFDNQTGRQVDFDLRGTDEEVEARLRSQEESRHEDAPRSPGRPKLGVVSREVTLLPRHWDWLSKCKGGASAELRRLIDAARKQDDRGQAAREAQQTADRFMMAMLGNRPGYEDATRALYAGDRRGFLALTEPWPAALRDHARHLAEPAFPV